MKQLPATLGLCALAALTARAQVKEAPYSADVQFEHSQVLADGTRISQQFVARRVFRDSLGRVRNEQPLMQTATFTDPAVVVVITDPVAGVQYTLDVQRKIAHRVAISPNAPAPPAAAPAVKETARAVESRRALPAGPPQETRTESLGTQIVAGGSARGARTTTTYLTGALGNDRPFSLTSETWTAADLDVPLIAKTSDPRSGDTIYRLINLSRTEPDPSLFQVPADYTIVDEKGPFTLSIAP